jgi:hypothetical protein
MVAVRLTKDGSRQTADQSRWGSDALCAEVGRPLTSSWVRRGFATLCAAPSPVTGVVALSGLCFT